MTQSNVVRTCPVTAGLVVEEGNGDFSARLISARPLTSGALVFEFSSAQVVTAPTYQTVQVGVGVHVDELGVMAYLNHSCDPNVVVDTLDKEVRALREIGAGEELTFFYPSTEWDMAQPFACRCGAKGCLQHIRGAKHLTLPQLAPYRQQLNEHINELIEQHASSAPESPAAFESARC